MVLRLVVPEVTRRRERPRELVLVELQEPMARVMVQVAGVVVAELPARVLDLAAALAVLAKSITLRTHFSRIFYIYIHF